MRAENMLKREQEMDTVGKMVRQLERRNIDTFLCEFRKYLVQVIEMRERDELGDWGMGLASETLTWDRVECVLSYRRRVDKR